MKRPSVDQESQSKRCKIDRLEILRGQFEEAKTSGEAKRLLIIGNEILQIDPSDIDTRFFVMLEIGNSEEITPTMIRKVSDHCRFIISSPNASDLHIGMSEVCLSSTYGEVDDYQNCLNHLESATNIANNKVLLCAMSPLRGIMKESGVWKHSLRARKLFLKVSQQILPSHFDEEVYEDFHASLRTCDFQKWMKIDPIMRNPEKRLMSVWKDAYVDWSLLTNAHKKFVEVKYPDIKEALMKHAQSQEFILLHINTLFSDATVGLLHDFLYFL